MNGKSPWRFGAALAVTIAVGYGLCTVVFGVWPESAAGFMMALFHGLDFRKLQAGPSLFNFESFGYATVVLAGWAFMLGTLFAWLWSYLAPKR